MAFLTRLALAAALVVVSACASQSGGPSGLAGRWALDADRTAQVQPDNSRRRSRSSAMPHTTVAVGGVPLPSTGGSGLPSVPGKARDPSVLHATSLTIEPGGDELTLVYDGQERETLQRGDDQGLISDWNRDSLSSRYETTSRKVSQVYQLQRDGSLLVTVKLDPNAGAAAVYKRVFNRVTSDTAP